MKRSIVSSLFVCFAGLGLLHSVASAQAVTVSWPLTSTTAWTSSSNALAIGVPETVSPGVGYTMSIFDYWSGQGQRMYAGTTGWLTSGVTPTRYLQFNASPAAGHQLTVNSISVDYGGANNANQIHADVRYSTNNWTTWTSLGTAILYQPHTLVTFSAPVTTAPIPNGGTFSLRIYPYAVSPSMASIPTFAAHAHVRINANSAVINVPQVRLHLTKSTGSTVVPGNYSFHITCTGPGGPYTGTNPVIVPLPGSGVDAQVPQGDTCTVAETPVGGWTAPTWGGSTAPIVPNGWSAQIGPMPVNTTMTVTNHPPATSTTIGFTISKLFSGTVVPGTYTFHISCTGGYTGPSTVNLVVPNASSTVINVPVGATCQISETPIPGWQTPTIGGSTQPINPNLTWGATVGPFHATGNMMDQMKVTNNH